MAAVSGNDPDVANMLWKVACLPRFAHPTSDVSFFFLHSPARELNQVSPTSEIICSRLAAQGRELFMVRPEKIFLLTQEEHCYQRKPEHSEKRKKKNL